ncbi:hypothetical protein SAMN04487968_101465 [Nocardioides terrae]|uniref:HEAT repeat-containing protein n=2 Tax=Nocardioides terrae TaxID=574651 RepID=A0A1I1DS87_9ACTN|nr:hypothetical protein SAMN04487968_101465 [Nocardioides terrae]
MLDDPDPIVRAGGVMELPELVADPPSDLVARVVLLSDDADDEVRDAACFVLGTQWDQRDSPALRKLVLGHLEGWADDGAPDALAEAVRRLTDPAGPGDDLFAGVAELHRRRSRDEDESDVIGWWRLMDRMLDLAPHRGHEFLDGTDRHLEGDPAAGRWLREQSALASLVAATEA